MKRPMLTALLLVVACSSEPLPAVGHVLVHFDTDAPLPSSLEAPPVEPLFDRLLVEVFAPGANAPCAGCRRELALDAQSFRDHTASIQVPTPAGREGYRARTRLFLARHALGGEPLADGAVETVVALPPAPVDGPAEVTIFLSAEGVGTKRGSLEAPIPPDPGPPSGRRVGTWPGAVRKACPDRARAGEVCVPGGAFWMGRPGERPPRAEVSTSRPRLVVMEPYYLDEEEVSVADVRSFEVSEPGISAWSGASAGATMEDFCTFTAKSGPNDALPVACVTWSAARHYCLSIGKDLPTEARYEYAAGAFAGRRFGWGDDPPLCGDAVWGRGGGGVLAPIAAPCRAERSGPACVGPGCEAGRARDMVRLDGGTIRDLAGNLSEWSLDRFNSQDEACWAAPGLRRDPLCVLAGAGGLRASTRGGSWLAVGSALAASARDSLTFALPDVTVGFRCARDATPNRCGLLRPGLYTGTTSGGENAVLLTVGVGCSGVVSAIGARESGEPFSLIGHIDSEGRVSLDGMDLTGGGTQSFVGDVVDDTHMAGTWTSSSRRSGRWRVSPKPLR